MAFRGESSGPPRLRESAPAILLRRAGERSQSQDGPCAPPKQGAGVWGSFEGAPTHCRNGRVSRSSRVQNTDARPERARRVRDREQPAGSSSVAPSCEGFAWSPQKHFGGSIGKTQSQRGEMKAVGLDAAPVALN